MFLPRWYWCARKNPKTGQIQPKLCAWTDAARGTLTYVGIVFFYLRGDITGGQSKNVTKYHHGIYPVYFIKTNSLTMFKNAKESLSLKFVLICMNFTDRNLNVWIKPAVCGTATEAETSDSDHG